MRGGGVAAQPGGLRRGPTLSAELEADRTEHRGRDGRGPDRRRHPLPAVSGGPGPSLLEFAPAARRFDPAGGGHDLVSGAGDLFAQLGDFARRAIEGSHHE